MSAEAEEPAKAPAAEAPAAAAAGGGMSPMVFFGAMGLSWVLMLGGGFALVQFVLPSKLAEAIKQPAAGEAGDKAEGGHGEKADAKAEEKGHGEAKAEGKKEEKGGHGEAKAEGKKEEKGGHGEAKAEGKKEEGGEKAAMPKPKEFVLSEIVVNIAGSRGARYIKASVYFDANPDVLEDLERQRARVIDLISSALASKTMDELTAPNARGLLREELLATCNGLLKKGQINNLYFVDFLIQ